MNTRFIPIVPKFLILFLLIFVAGCSSGVSGFSIAPDPTVNETDLVSETIYIRNCADFVNEKRTPLTERAPVHFHVVVDAQATSDETGDVVDIPDDLKTKLQMEIENEYQDLYDEKQAVVEKVDLVVPPYSIRIFEVKWKEECACSTVAFEMDKQKYSADYYYKLEYPTLSQTLSQACTA